MFGFGKKKEIEREIKEDMKEQKENQLKWYHYLISLLFVLVGVVFIAYVQMDTQFICSFFACVFAIAGVVSILSYCIKDVAVGYYKLDLVYGVIALFAALVFFTKQDVVGVYFPVIVGFILFANGVVKLQHSIDMKRIDRKMKKVTEMWLVVMIFALMCISAGAVAVYLTPSSQRTMFLFVGIALVVAGITDVFTHIVFNRKVKLLRSGDYMSDSEEEAQTSENAVQDDEIIPDENSGIMEDVTEDAFDHDITPEVPEDTVLTDEPVTETEENAEDAVDQQTQG